MGQPAGDGRAQVMGLVRRWLRRAPDAPVPDTADHTEFDAVIDLGPRDMPAGTDPAAAVRAVRVAVSAMPGANWINVGRHDGSIPAGLPWMRVFPAGSSIVPDGPGWDRVRVQVAEAVQGALAALPAGSDHAAPSAPDYDALPVPVLAGGFADSAGFIPFPGPAAVTPAEQTTVSRVASGEAAALDDTALAEVLLSLVLPGDPRALAAQVVGRFGSFAALLSAPVRELQAVPGLGPHSVAAIKLVHATALRASQAGLMHRLVLDDMTRLTDYLAAVLARERIEQFRILFLDDAQCLIADEAQARGTVNHTPVYPREVVRRAIELRAAAVVLVHNHPSGDPTPSREDVEMTATVRDAAALLGITVRDHIIVGNGRWVSLRDARMM